MPHDYEQSKKRSPQKTYINSFYAFIFHTNTYNVPLLKHIGSVIIICEREGVNVITDAQFKDLRDKYEELNAKYTQMSKDIAAIKMSLDFAKGQKLKEPAQAKKDVTRYSFLGMQLNKRELVLKGIKKYIADSGTTSATDLQKSFPDWIQGPLGVIRPVEEAEKYIRATDRYFFRDDDVLHLDEGVYVVSKDWTIKNIKKFIDIMETLNYEITPIVRY